MELSQDRTPVQLLDEALQAQLASGCPGAILEISAPRHGFAYRGARGLFARNGARPLRADDAFRAASVTKAVTAATAVCLAAAGRWSLDDPAVHFLPPRVTATLRGLKGLNDTDSLTLRRLLGHTSGLPDYFFDARFQARVQSEPQRVWQPEELVAAAAEAGALLFAPGTDFAYGDSAYVVVGMAIENLLGCNLAEAYRAHVFDPLGMGATCLEWHDTPCGDNLSHHYRGSEDLRDSNLSFDWAGGGLVTTAGDLTRFLRGLFGGALFSRRWLEECLRWHPQTRWRPNSSARYIRYGLGLGTNMAYGEELVGATGVWGAFAYYWPAADATLAGTLNLVGADRAALLDEAVRALSRLGPASA